MAIRVILKQRCSMRNGMSLKFYKGAVTILFGMLISSCYIVYDVVSPGPYWTVDYEINGISYHDEERSRTGTVKDKCGSPEVYQDPDNQDRIVFSWDVYKPIWMYIIVKSDSDYFESGNKYFLELDGYNNLGRDERWPVNFQKPSFMGEESYIIANSNDSWLEFYEGEDEGVRYVIKFEYAVEYLNDSKLDTLIVKNGQYVLYEKFMPIKQIPIK